MRLGSKVRYYHVEKSKSFYFIAMELAVGTVDDYVERKQHTSEVDEMAILRDSSIALEWLHGQTITTEGNFICRSALFSSVNLFVLQ
ncbi:hypothetical protein FJT64_005999 [Amphibalanus amphitrite]|uniref:Uncharacterized protein n=1 Tax=Amphibalanus amphitrite TaxID=1232801 RepID=A0A6A4VQR1_AMPAM|nr:hypothetical protein FJT64_005999 [Amphibalanus amphitrite]